MAGSFSKAQRPTRPGVYFNFQAAEQEPTLQNTLGIVAIPIVADWGPENQVEELPSFGDYLATYGVTRGGGYISVAGAFKGEGLPGRGGAATVLAYRLVPSDAAAATHSLSNGSTGAITLTAKYKGTRGNNFTVGVAAVAGSSTLHILTIYGDQGATESYTYTKTDITDLAAQINAHSTLVTAGSVTTGTALTLVGTPAALTGGAAGTVTTTEWTAAQSAYESWRFSLFAPYQEVSSGILQGLAVWSAGLNRAGKKFVTVVGGVAGESVATAITRTSTDLNCTGATAYNFVNLGGGTYTDETYGDLSTGQLASRIAGILARRGEAQSITFARLAGITIKQGPTEAEIVAALGAGVTVMSRDSHPTAPVRIEKGLTAWTTTSDADHPLAIYSIPKFVRTLQSIEVEITEFLEENVIGILPVNSTTREYVIGQISFRLAAREAAGVIQGGWTVATDQNPPPSPSDDFIALVYGVTLGRSLEQVLNTVVVG